MKKTLKALQQNKSLRVVGFDDAPFDKSRGSSVNIAGVVCANTRFEGMLWGEVEKDGMDATDHLIEIVTKSKFHLQLHALLLDGIAFGGFNIVDLPRLSASLSLPCIAVMRTAPDISAVFKALDNFNNADERKRLIEQAGEVFEREGFVFQAQGIDSEQATKVLHKITDTGHVPEPLRLAHLIGAAVKTGQSSRRA